MQWHALYTVSALLSIQLQLVVDKPTTLIVIAWASLVPHYTVTEGSKPLPCQLL